MNDEILENLKRKLDERPLEEFIPVQALVPVVPDAPVPEAVIKFCDGIDKNFIATAERLEATANAMVEAAARLESKAKELRAMAPNLSKDLHDWVGFERTASEENKYWSTLFKTGG